MLEFNLFADYFQFYIQDEAADGDLSDAWSDEAVDQLFAVGPGVVGIGTVRNMDVPVTVEILDAEKPIDFAEWDHVVECTLVTESANLVIAGCTDYFPDAARIPVAPGTYRLRACYAGLDTLSDDGLEGNDRYHLQLWRAPAVEPVVLKQRVA
ncbi:hypothetical protein NU688_21980 [Variovorax sp. ZS18.2.2]|uniref:hypothetical protein n=1 Tax=Variovorax sp. ZS18.2.2 TaxID=2971255 RepID=UPI0021518184|nr:hypothetical protein [Variovorax sp. ZS18.2.2]MCR6478843.1 hypothetical protein [Variovorax sp. ZS18.2.2]